MIPPANFNALWARALIDELRRGGVRDAVVCPGSRSAPLALACAELLEVRTVIDERSAAFFALGAARAAGRPMLVVATSGSAGAHFYPAILEAEAAGVPLIALTADRPPELHGFGAPQTMDQQRLFGLHAQFADLGLPDPLALSHLRALASRAVRPDGPSHLNAPFREPLAPVPEPLPEVRDLPALRHQPARALPDLGGVARELSRRPRGVIVCGPRDAQDELPAAVGELSRALGYPILADAASQVRFALPSALAHADLILRSEPWARALRPDAVLRIGGGLSSKIVQAYLEQAGYTAVLHERGALVDPAHTASVAIEGDAVATCRALAAEARCAGERAPFAAAEAHSRATLQGTFAEAEARARAALASAFADAPWSEPLIAREAALAADQLYVSSSMPVRDLDNFASRGGRVLANRGLNGIDGIVSSAAGAASVRSGRTVALVGDLALLHDLGGLVAAARLRIPLTVLAVHNDGGGIFSFLPIAQHTDRFEELFATPHGQNLEGAALLCGAEFVRVTDARSLRAALQAPPALRLIEARTDRARNVEQHRALQQAVIDALGSPP